MERLSAHRALQLAAYAVPVIKHLTATNQTMTRKQFGQAIGLVRQAWRPWHANQINIVLAIIRDAHQYLDENGLEYHRVGGTSLHDGHWYRGRWIAEKVA